MVIDFHAHYPNEPDFSERLVVLMPQADIDVICLCGGRGVRSRSNEVILQAARKYPNRIIAFALVELGKDTPDVVDQYAAEGYGGFKITNPCGPYDEEAYFPVYERMERTGLPLLAHTGILMRIRMTPGRRLSSRWMRPACLDAVVRSFPGLNIVGAHLGAPWHEEASMMARMHSNYYVDLTGAWWGGWCVNKTPEFYRYHFFWENAWDKVVFGSDILKLEELIPSKKLHDDIIAQLGLPDRVLQASTARTAARLLRIGI